MATENPDDIGFIQRAILNAVKERVAEILADEIANANKRVAERVAAETDRIALKLLSHYAVEHHRGEILITVRKAL